MWFEGGVVLKGGSIFLVFVLLYDTALIRHGLCFNKTLNNAYCSAYRLQAAVFTQDCFDNQMLRFTEKRFHTILYKVINKKVFC